MHHSENNKKGLTYKPFLLPHFIPQMPFSIPRHPDGANPDSHVAMQDHTLKNNLNK